MENQEFNIIGFDFMENTITLDAEEYFKSGGSLNFGTKFIKSDSSVSSVRTDKLSAEKLQERCDRYEKALTEIREAYANYKIYDPDEDDGYAGGDVTSSFIDEVGEALAAIGGVE